MNRQWSFHEMLKSVVAGCGLRCS